MLLGLTWSCFNSTRHSKSLPCAIARPGTPASNSIRSPPSFFTKHPRQFPRTVFATKFAVNQNLRFQLYLCAELYACRPLVSNSDDPGRGWVGRRGDQLALPVPVVRLVCFLPSPCLSADTCAPGRLLSRLTFISASLAVRQRPRQRSDHSQHAAKTLPREMPFGQKQPVIARMFHQPSARLHQGLLQTRQRPVPNLLRQR